MKCLSPSLALAIASLFFASVVIAGDPVTIKESEAANHIGKEVEVRGVVSEVSMNRQGTVIVLGGKYPDEIFVGIVKSGTALSSEKAFLESLEGKEIGIVGKVELFRTKPAIKIRLKDQIKVGK
jgi:hypothetical protein